MVEKSELTAAAARLRSRLRGVGDHQRGVWFGEGIGLFVAVLVPTLGLVMVTDNLMHLPAVLRTALLVAWVAAAALLIRYAARLLAQPLNAEQIALKVEARFPDVDNRLINSLLLADEDDAEAFQLIRTVMDEGNADAAKLPLNAAVPKRRLRIFLAVAALSVALMTAYAVAYPKHFANALARCLVPFSGKPPLTNTQIVQVAPGDANILSGDDVALAVVVGGRLPRTAEIFYTPEGDDTKILAMHPDEDAEAGDPPTKTFQSLMTGISNTFTYYAAAGDARSRETYTVTVHHRPVVSELAITVTPPPYAGLKPMVQRSGTIKALAGSSVRIQATCSKPIAQASLALSTAKEPTAMAVDGKTVRGSFVVHDNGVYRIHVTDTAPPKGFANRPVPHDVEVIADEPPEVELVNPPPTVTIKPNGSVAFEGVVRDRYGIQSVEIVKVVKQKDGPPKDLGLWRQAPEGKTVKKLTVNQQVSASQLQIEPGKSAVLQLVARDWNDVTGPGVARSRQVLVTVMSTQQAKKETNEALKLAVAQLAAIIKKQRRNITLGRSLRAAELKEPGTLAKSPARLTETTGLQEEIRTDTAALIGNMDDTVPMRAVLRSIYEGEMITAVQELKAVLVAKMPAEALQTAIDTERIILARLTGRGDQLRRLTDMAGLRDIFAALEELVRKQKKIRAQADEALAANTQGPNEPLADRQDKLAAKVLEFKDLLAEQARLVGKSDEDAARQFDQANKMVDSRKVRENMIRAATKLAKGDMAAAIPIHDDILAALADIEKFLRKPIVAKATQKLEDLEDAVEDAKKKAEKLAALQAKIKEISEELERSKDLRPDKAQEMQEELAELQDLREKMADSVEKMAKDLSLFPEIPACNEMIEEAREIFEDIEQAKGSEKDKKATEIAVDRDEGLLDSLEKIKERLADMEMWMMDKPDGTKWKQEGVDVEEIKDIPLVDLPEEAEDIVGDLVDKEDELDQEAQDSTSNAMVPDLPAGWDIADGPISSFGAKGKSGNEKPNANEMTGRSGAGREGQSDGEMVDKVAKNLEGRETEARRTRDGFQAGEVEEEEGGHPQKAKATGGGKQSGTGGEGGLRGAAPARDELKMRDLERRQRNLRRNTEALYSKATLMYLPTGELDAAILLMQKAEEQARNGDFSGFSETHQRIVHALRNSQRLMKGQSAVEIDPRLKLPANIKEEMVDAKDEPIPPEFEKLVAEYYKAIAAGSVK